MFVIGIVNGIDMLVCMLCVDYKMCLCLGVDAWLCVPFARCCVRCVCMVAFVVRVVCCLC